MKALIVSAICGLTATLVGCAVVPCGYGCQSSYYAPRPSYYSQAIYSRPYYTPPYFVATWHHEHHHHDYN